MSTQHLYRNLLDNQIYKLYHVTPRSYTGGWFEAENVANGGASKIKFSPDELPKFFVIVSEI
jgi:hypothetical protein